MSMMARFSCEECQTEFILLEGLELADVMGDESHGSGMSEDSLSTLAQKRTSVSVIDFINSLQLHREKCPGKVVYSQSA
jgi:hypothetical protein